MMAEVFLSNILHVIFALGLISYVAPWFLLALVPLVITFFIMFNVFTQTVRDMKRQDMVSKSPLISHITASVQGITTIYAYSKTKDFLKRSAGMSLWLKVFLFPFLSLFCKV